MTITSNTRLHPVQPVDGAVTCGILECANEGVALSIPVAYAGTSTYWEYSATAEGRTGEVAVGDTDMDEQPGLIYTGPTHGQVQVNWSNVDLKAVSVLAPEATDEFSLIVYLNNEPRLESDEGEVAELDTGTAEFNGSGVISGLQSGDVIRFALMVSEGNEDALIANLSEGGQITIR